MWRDSNHGSLESKMKISTPLQFSHEIFDVSYSRKTRQIVALTLYLLSIDKFSNFRNNSLRLGWDFFTTIFWREKKIVKLNRVKFPIHSRFFKVSFTLAAWLLDGGATRKTACAQNTHARQCGPSLQRRRAVPRQARPLNNETQFNRSVLQV